MSDDATPLTPEIVEEICNHPINIFAFYTQLITPIFLSVLISVLLRPLGMPKMVSQILAGLLSGVVAPFDVKSKANIRTNALLENYSLIGMVIQMFLIGVQLNTTMLLKGGKKGLVIGISVVIFPTLLTIISGTIIKAVFDINTENFALILKVGIFKSFNAFPVIVSLLTELNMVNMEFSQVTFVASMISGALSFAILTAFLLYIFTAYLLDFFLMLFGCVITVVLVVFFLRPAIRWMIRQVPEGQPMKDAFVCAVFAAVLIIAYVPTLFGLHYMLGPFLLGIVIPPGPPLGTALVDRLEFFTTWMMMPLFYTTRGMLIEPAIVKTQDVVFVGSIVLINFAGKFLAAFFPALYFSMTYKNALLVGLALNTQGFAEIAAYKFLMTQMLIPVEIYTVMVYAVVFVTGVSVLPIKYIYKSMMNYKTESLRTIQHLEPNTHLQVLACIYSEENVPSIMHFVKAINPTKDSPVNLSVLHMVELTGHATSVIISHKIQRKRTSVTAASRHIVNVFKQYEDSDRRRISVNPYTVVSAYAAMHDYACVVGLQQRISFIILPYHRDLLRGVTNDNIRTVNRNILEKAPCSVGILIDRGLVGGIKSVLENWSSYRVAVLFLGGADDREALALGERMSGHPIVELTVFRFLKSKSDNVESDTASHATPKSVDDEMVRDFQTLTSYNNRVRYMQKEVNDGVDVLKVLGLLEDTYQMIIIGRRHDEKSPLITGLSHWERNSEIGVIGDTLLTDGYGRDATILVVQQQTSVDRTSFALLLDEEETLPRSQEPL